jgi:hypothetical protein
MQKSVYFKEDAKTKELLRRVEALGKMYGNASFSELVVAGLHRLVATQKEGEIKGEDSFKKKMLAGLTTQD